MYYILIKKIKNIYYKIKYNNRFAIYNNTNLPTQGWFHSCIECGKITGKTITYNYKNIYIVYTCPTCQNIINQIFNKYTSNAKTTYIKELIISIKNKNNTSIPEIILSKYLYKDLPTSRSKPTIIPFCKTQFI